MLKRERAKEVPMFGVGRQRTLFVCGLLLLGAVGIRAQDTGNNVPRTLVHYPDLIVHNAKIVTMDDTTPNGPPGTIVQAMAIRGDTIQILGTNDQVLRLA